MLFSLHTHKSTLLLLKSVCCLLLLSQVTYGGNTITACGHHDYPPWNWVKKGEIVGVCAEITKTLFNQLGYEVDMGYVGPWSRCQKK